MSHSRHLSPFVDAVESLVVPTIAGAGVETNRTPFVHEESSTGTHAQEETGPDPSELTQIEWALRQGGSPSENIITNHLFHRRHPELKGRALRASETALVREWRRIRDTQVRPYVRHSLSLRGLDPMLLAMYLSQYEGDTRVPPAAEMAFLRDPALLSMGRSLRDRVLWNWRSGRPPLTAARFFALALELSGHTGFAALLCHNVAKAFSKGATAIHWQRVSAPDGTYTGSGKHWTARVHHRDGVLLHLGGGPSIFYVLFHAKEFGTADHGDWYHYFVAATVTAFGTINDRAAGPTPAGSKRGLEATEDLETLNVRPFRDVEDFAYPLLLRAAIGRLRSQMTDQPSVAAAGYRGWVLANTLSFLEGAHYGKSQNEVARESRIHLRGAIFGVQRAGETPRPDWRWFVPKAASVGKAMLVGGFSLSGATAEVLSAGSSASSASAGG